MGDLSIIQNKLSAAELISRFKKIYEDIKRPSGVDPQLESFKKTISDLESFFNSDFNFERNVNGVNFKNNLANSTLRTKLEENISRLNSQIENTKNSIWMIDNNLLVVITNSNFKVFSERVFGFELKEGQNALKELELHGLSTDKWKKYYTRALEGESFKILYDANYKKTPNFYEISFNPIRVRNKIIGVSCTSNDISVKKIAEKDLKQKTEELNTIFYKNPSIMLLMDENKNIISINRSGDKYISKGKTFGYDKLGEKVLKCVNAVRNNGNCFKSENCENCLIRSTLLETWETKKNKTNVEGSIIIENNGIQENHHFLISTYFIHLDNDTRLLVSVDDITEMKKTQLQINKLSIAVEQSNVSIIITDINGNIQYANPQVEKTSGYKIEELIGKNTRIFSSGNTDQSDYKKLWKKILSGETWKGEFLNVSKNGNRYWENTLISPIFNDNNEVISFIAIKEDITEKKKIQEALIKSEKELRHLNDDKNRFFSIMAHDLRGLVGNYHVYTDLLFSHFNEFSTSDIKEQLKRLSQSSNDTLLLLDNLLDWGKATMDKVKIVPTYFDVKKETGRIFEILKEPAKSKKIKLNNKVEPNIQLLADTNIFMTIVRNLINNAIKFTPNNGLVTASARIIENNYLEFSVTDTGVGMDDELKAKLFITGEKVVREDTNHEKSTGLGLLICHELAKKLGGSISVESEKGKGSRFIFTLPRE